MALASQAKAVLERRLTPMAKVTRITEQFQHFLAEMKESFWGDLYGQDAAGVEEVFRSRVGAAAGPVQRLGLVPAAAGARARLSQRLLRTGFRHPLRHAATAYRPHARGKNFLPPGLEKFQRRAPELTAADPGGVFARHLHPAGRAGGGHVDRPGGECANRFAVDAAIWTRRCGSFIRRRWTTTGPICFWMG